MGYNARKAAQLVAYFAIKNGKKDLDVLKAVKLVYLADRRSAALFGFPILDENRVSMPHGPVNSETYAQIQGERQAGSEEWSEFLKDREDHQVGLRNQSIEMDDLDELSEADIEVLDDVWLKFGGMEKWELVNWTHDKRNIPEWEDPNGSSRKISPIDLLTFAGVPNANDQADEIYELRSEDEKFRAFDRS